MFCYVIILICFLKSSTALNASVLHDDSYVDINTYGNYSYFGGFDEDYQVTPEEYEEPDDVTESVALTTSESSKVASNNHSGYLGGTLYDDYGCSITAAPPLEPHLALFLTIIIIYFVVQSLQEQ
uniref:Uncharacterized protein n=1 Tax=Homalodisca liturata TaxID=320908 RepID=A0A1B6IMZ4_9HEMI